MSLDYNTYISQVSNMMVIPSSDTNFQTMVPGMIDYAEQRIYRELDLVVTQITDNSTTVTASNRNFTLPTSIGKYITVDNVNIITPSGSDGTNGTRNPLTPVARDFIDMVYPSGQLATGIPLFYARASDNALIFGPSPDASYSIEVVGTQRPTPLSSNNSTTFLTSYLPDLFMAASLVFGFGYMRDFGGQADNPGASQSWESQYQLLFKSANSEEMRKKYEDEGWTSQSPATEATPPRV